MELLTAARKRFGIATHPIAEGGVADLTLFSTEGTTEFKESDILSASKNSVFVGATMKGKVIGVIANKQLILNN